MTQPNTNNALQVAEQALPDLITSLQALIKQVANNQPGLTSDRFDVTDTITVPNATETTVTFQLDPMWVTHITEASCESANGVSYTWTIQGKSYNSSLVQFVNGAVISNPTATVEVTLVIANTSGSSVVLTYSLQGWGDRSAG